MFRDELRLRNLSLRIGKIYVTLASILAKQKRPHLRDVKGFRRESKSLFNNNRMAEKHNNDDHKDYNNQKGNDNS